MNKKKNDLSFPDNGAFSGPFYCVLVVKLRR